jgi:hypothetical protein
MGGGTCASTCAKSIALSCPSGEHDQAACEASCAMQKSACSSQAAAFQAYLDCIETTPMECGSATGAPSSPQCVSQGLAIFQCALDGMGGGGAGGGSASLGAAAEALCEAACACTTCSSADLANCITEYSGGTYPTQACTQLAIDQTDCATAKLSGCGTTLDAALQQCKPTDAQIAAAGC